MTTKYVYEATLETANYKVGVREVLRGSADMDAAAQRANRSFRSFADGNVPAGLQRIGGSASSASGAMRGLESSATSAGREIRSAISGGISLLTKFAALGAAAAGILTGLAAKFAILDSAKFESTIGRIGIQTGADPSQMRSLMNHARDVGVETPFGPQAVADAMFAEAQRGRGVDEILKLTEATKKFAVVANGDMKTAAETLSQAMFQFGLPMEQAEATAMRLANATASTALDLNDLFTSLTYAGGAAGTFKVDLTELLAVLGTLRTVAGASVGSTAVRNIMLVASKLGNKSQKKLKELGLDEEDIAGTTFMSGAPKSIMEVVHKLNELAAARPESLMKMGFETRTIVALRQIEDMRDRIEAVKVQIDDLDGAQAKYAKSIELADNQYRRLETTAGAVMTSIGGKIREAFALDDKAGGLSDYLANLSRDVAAMPASNVREIADTLGSGVIQAFAVGIEFLLAAMQPVGVMFGKALMSGIGQFAENSSILESLVPELSEQNSYKKAYRAMTAVQRAAEDKRLGGLFGRDTTLNLSDLDTIFTTQPRHNQLRAMAMHDVMAGLGGSDSDMRDGMRELQSAFSTAQERLRDNPTVRAAMSGLSSGREAREAEAAAAARQRRFERQAGGGGFTVLQSGVVNNYGAPSAAARARPTRPSGTTAVEGAGR